MNRGDYGQVLNAPAEVLTFQAEVLKELQGRKQIEAPYVRFDRKGRGAALNYDLYGYDLAGGLIVVQARQASRRSAGHYLSVRKTYALAGRNEDNSSFWHPVEAMVIHAAIRQDADNPAAPIRAAMAWIFEVSQAQLASVARQGDVALVPVTRPSGASIESDEATLAESHILTGRLFRQDGERLYVLDPTMRHSRGQHATISAQGWHRVAVGRAARAWDFSPRSVD